MLVYFSYTQFLFFQAINRTTGTLLNNTTLHFTFGRFRRTAGTAAIAALRNWRKSGLTRFSSLHGSYLRH